MRLTSERILTTARVVTLALAVVVLPASISHAWERCDGGHGMGYRIDYGHGFDRYGMSSGGFGTAYPGLFGYGMGISGFGGERGSYGGYGMPPGAYGIVHPGEPSFGQPGLSGIGGFYPIYGLGR